MDSIFNPIVQADFLLDSPVAQALYHEVAARQPIIDYHCHLDPVKIADNYQFRSITEAWLDGDHYKWRAMRIHGVEERYCTGAGSDWEKFDKWAETVPFTLRNPLYHWTHLELQRPFGIETLLNPGNSASVFEQTNAFLAQSSGSIHAILSGMGVTFIGTTDDPCDDLAAHIRHRASGHSIRMAPTFRPDQAIQTTDLNALNAYLDRLGAVTDSNLEHFIDLLNALQQRVDFFDVQGCRMSDHGLNCIPWTPYTDAEVNDIFHKIRLRSPLSQREAGQYQSSLLFHLGGMYHEKGWVMQLHLGALRSNNRRMLARLGKDTGWDSIGDFSQAEGLSAFLDRLDSEDQLPKTILYNLNPADNHVFASMTGNFCDGSVAAKVQWGSAWWFLDQLDGMEEQIDVLSNLGLLSHFVGMLTDSRSFLSFPRHDYFRRILCRKLGRDVAAGLLPDDRAWLGTIVERICYHNAKEFIDI
ncbi:MAG: glucuronate isomerase [Chloroflexi bacterium AL-W]|nr:glucuronate isomerase [Chloroflexi bacterium AL-W]